MAMEIYTEMIEAGKMAHRNLTNQARLANFPLGSSSGSTVSDNSSNLCGTSEGATPSTVVSGLWHR